MKEKEERRAGKAGKAAAGDFQNLPSKRAADIWHNRAETWGFQNEGKVP